MNFTNEQIEKAKAAKSVEELLALAKENGVELSEEEAAKYFAEWHKEGELSDDELDNVVGGGCGTSEPKYFEGQMIYSGTSYRYRIRDRRYNEEKEMWEYGIIVVYLDGTTGSCERWETEWELDTYYHT